MCQSSALQCQQPVQTVAPTVTSDRACAALRVCSTAAEYESLAATPTSNRACSPVSLCSGTCVGVATTPLRLPCRCPGNCYSCAQRGNATYCLACKNSAYWYRGQCYPSCSGFPGMVPAGNGSFRTCRYANGTVDPTLATPEQHQAAALTPTSDRVC